MSELQNVIALTKLHISQQYKESDWIHTDPETFEYFKTFAKKHKGSTTEKPKQQVRPPLPIKQTPRPKPVPLKVSEKKTTKPIHSEPQSTDIKREKLKPATEVEFSDFRKIIKEHFPSQKMIDKHPDDAKAKEYALRWKKTNIPPEIIILDSARSPSEKLFLDNVARALEATFYPTAVISVEQWAPPSELRLVVGTVDALKNISHSHMVMEPVAHYFQNPQLKAKLWQDLKNTLQSS